MRYNKDWEPSGPIYDPTSITSDITDFPHTLKHLVVSLSRRLESAVAAILNTIVFSLSFTFCTPYTIKVTVKENLTRQQIAFLVSPSQAEAVFWSLWCPRRWLGCLLIRSSVSIFHNDRRVVKIEECSSSRKRTVSTKIAKFGNRFLKVKRTFYSPPTRLHSPGL